MADTQIGTGNVIRVRVPVAVANDLDKMGKVTRDVLTRLGCGGCHSGFDIRFLQESEFLVDENLNVRGIGSAGQP